MVPLLDILQSVPILSFLPTVILSLVAAFPLQRRPGTGEHHPHFYQSGLEYDV